MHNDPGTGGGGATPGIAHRRCAPGIGHRRGRRRRCTIRSGALHLLRTSTHIRRRRTSSCITRRATRIITTTCTSNLRTTRWLALSNSSSNNNTTRTIRDPRLRLHHRRRRRRLLRLRLRHHPSIVTHPRATTAGQTRGRPMDTQPPRRTPRAGTAVHLATERRTLGRCALRSVLHAVQKRS